MKDVDSPGMGSYVCRLEGASAFSDIEPILQDFAIESGFHYYLLRVVLRLQPGPGVNLRATNYPLNWLEHYASSGYNMIDPAAHHARSRTLPAFLHRLPASLVKPLLYSRFDQDVRGAGLHEGITIPLCTTTLWGFLNLNAPRCPPLTESKLNSWLLFSGALVETLARVTRPGELHSRYDHLTRREREVLFWASSGKTAWETSEILGITERTVIAHLTKSMKTIGCVNKPQLVGAISFLLDSDLDLQSLRQNL